MNNSCLYCFRELEEGQVDFHEECAIQLFGVATPRLGDAFVVKEVNDECGYWPEVEATAMRMAQAVMILTAPSSLVRTAGGGVAFARRRELLAESLPTLVERLEECEFDGSAEMIAELVEDFSSIARLDVVNLFEQILFGWTIGCDDMSLSSFALLRPNAGVCSLAPAFDLVPQLAQEQSQFGLSINGKRKNIRRKDFEAAMRHMGLKDRIIRITIEKMIKAKEQWFDVIDRAPLSDEQRSKFKQVVIYRISTLQKG